MLFSIVIPTHNRVDSLMEAIESIRRQAFPDYEVIVVDDGSTDGTADAAEREFAVFREQFSGNSKSNIQNPTFKILHQKNTGPGAARNLGAGTNNLK